VLFLAAACGKGSATPEPAPQHRDAGTVVPDADPNRLEGAALYKTFCAQCHGDDAKGYKSDHAPSLINPTFLASASDEYLRRSIVFGRPGTAMAGYGSEVGGPLRPEPVARIVTWIRSHGEPAQPLAAVGGGDPTRGASVYQKNCKVCHGDQGVRGEAVHLANPQFLAAATDSFVEYAIVHGRPGTRMEPWQGKLSAQDIDDVVAFVRTLASPLQVGQLPPPTGKEPLVINPGGKDPSWKLRGDPCPPGAPGCDPEPRFASADQVKQALDEKRKVVIIDARPPSDWMHVHITGAASIPYHDLKRLDEIPQDVWVVAYCACPHHLSGVVVDELRKRGHKKSAVLDEGILEWHRRGYPVVAAPGVQPPPKEPAFAPGTIP